MYVLAGAVCISVSPLFVKLDDTGPSAVAFYRLFWGGLALLLVALARRERILPGRTTLLVCILPAAVFFCGDLVTWHWSILHVGPGLATILSNFQVFFLALFGVVFLREPLGWRLGTAIPLALFGLLLLLDADPRHLPPGMGAGLACGLISALFYTGYILCLRRSQSAAQEGRLPAIANMGVISLVSAVFVAAVALADGETLLVTSARSNLLLLTYGIGCQGLGWLLLSKGLPLLPAARAGLIMLAQPSLSFVWDVVFFNRPTSAWGYCGAVGALLAICLGALEPGGKKSPPPKRGRQGSFN